MKKWPREGLSITLLGGYLQKINPKKQGFWAKIKKLLSFGGAA